MAIKRIELKNFRNHKKLDLNIDQQNVLIIGPNGSGKTNILESIFFASHLKTFKPSVERDLINIDADFAKAKVVLDNSDSVEFVISRKLDSNRVTKLVKINNVEKPITASIGYFKVVLFAPEHIRLVAGSPSRRREFLDRMLAQVDKNYLKNLYIYEKILKNRNKLLESITKATLFNPFSKEREQFEYWNKKLLEAGTIIQNARSEFFDFANSKMDEISKKVYGENNIILKLNYLKSELNETRLKDKFNDDVMRETTTIGPHRDDYDFLFNSYSGARQDDNEEPSDRNMLDLKSYGSRGQQRTAVLAVKILEIMYIIEKTSVNPILLLDDIFSELDENYRSHIVEIAKAQQTFITSADINNVPEEIKTSSLIINL